MRTPGPHPTLPGISSRLQAVVADLGTVNAGLPSYNDNAKKFLRAEHPGAVGVIWLEPFTASCGDKVPCSISKRQ